jgi:hypothetical protein
MAKQKVDVNTDVDSESGAEGGSVNINVQREASKLLEGARQMQDPAYAAGFARGVSVGQSGVSTVGAAGQSSGATAGSSAAGAATESANKADIGGPEAWERNMVRGGQDLSRYADNGQMDYAAHHAQLNAINVARLQNAAVLDNLNNSLAVLSGHDQHRHSTDRIWNIDEQIQAVRDIEIAVQQLLRQVSAIGASETQMVSLANTFAEIIEAAKK